MTTSKPTNILLWDFSLKNPENILDEYYFHDVTHLVIPKKKVSRTSPASISLSKSRLIK